MRISDWSSDVCSSDLSRPLVAGTIAASGTLAQIVPPSLVLIVMADQLGRSVGDMYVGALYPALLIVAAYCLYIFAVTMIKPQWAPALPMEARTLGNGVTSLAVMVALSVGLYYLGLHVLFAGVTSPERSEEHTSELQSLMRN